MALYRWSCVWRLIIIMWRQYFHCMKTWQSRYVIWSLYLSVSIYIYKYLCTSLFDLGKLLNEFILHMLHQKIHWRTISGFRNCCMNHNWLLGNLCDLQLLFHFESLLLCIMALPCMYLLQMGMLMVKWLLEVYDIDKQN